MNVKHDQDKDMEPWTQCQHNETQHNTHDNVTPTKMVTN